MIISCPKCSAGFYVAPTQIGATGRRVKCSKCKNIWHATVPEEIASKDEILANKSFKQNIVTGSNLPAIIPITIPPFLYIAPVIFSSLILLTLWLFYPDITDNFGMCGPMCAGNGVRIEEIAYDYHKDEKKVIVEYSIANRTNSNINAPLVQLNLIDSNNNILTIDRADLKGILLKPGKSLRAKAEFTNVSPRARYMRIAVGSWLKLLFI
ncbi:MAG: zinc-ribbon domain-containing protein [Rickettsiaceae bacterium]|nr:zinc-ribbon domain-containing protein [Rickettsiaceae bacterium]